MPEVPFALLPREIQQLAAMNGAGDRWMTVSMPETSADGARAFVWKTDGRLPVWHMTVKNRTYSDSSPGRLWGRFLEDIRANDVKTLITMPAAGDYQAASDLLAARIRASFGVQSQKKERGRVMPKTEKEETRIGDLERGKCIDALTEHFAAGRIDQAEFDTRSTKALACHFQSALDKLLKDLPGLPKPEATGKAPVKRKRKRKNFLTMAEVIGPALFVMFMMLAFLISLIEHHH